MLTKAMKNLRVSNVLTMNVLELVDYCQKNDILIDFGRISTISYSIVEALEQISIEKKENIVSNYDIISKRGNIRKLANAIIQTYYPVLSDNERINIACFIDSKYPNLIQLASIKDKFEKFKENEDLRLDHRSMYGHFFEHAVTCDPKTITPATDKPPNEAKSKSIANDLKSKSEPKLEPKPKTQTESSSDSAKSDSADGETKEEKTVSNSDTEAKSVDNDNDGDVKNNTDVNVNNVNISRINVPPLPLQATLSHSEVDLLAEFNYKELNFKLVIAAEMDAALADDPNEMVEIKCSNINKDNKSILHMHPRKLLNILTQCYFGGDIKTCVIGYREKNSENDNPIISEIKKVCILDYLTKYQNKNDEVLKILNVFNKCKIYVPFVLNWLKNEKKSMEKDTMYNLQFCKEFLQFSLKKFKNQEQFQDLIKDKTCKRGMIGDEQGNISIVNS